METLAIQHDLEQPIEPIASPAAPAQASLLQPQDPPAHAPQGSAITLTVERAPLLRCLGHVQSVVEKRNTIPILSHVKLAADGGALYITATDMDIAVTERVEAGVIRQGALTVPAHTFYDIVRKLPEGAQIRLEGDAKNEGKISITAGSAAFTLACLSAEEFPVMEEGIFTHHFSLTPAEAAALIDKTRFAISTEETRYYLNGIYLHTCNVGGVATLRTVATDGHRLARIEISLPAGATGLPGMIIPRKTVYEIKRLIEEAAEPIQVAASASKIRITMGNAVLTSKLIDGTFPDYDKVIPANNNRIMEVDAAALAEAVDRVSTISSEKTRGVRFDLDNGRLVLSANSPEAGTAREELEVNYAAGALEIGFNSRYLLEMLSQLEGDQVQFVFADTNAPALVRDSSDVGTLYVIMPMRV